MKIIDNPLNGLYLIQPKVFEDKRGYFFEAYNKEKFAEIGIEVNFVQDNQSKSSYGVIRGLHYQLPPYAQSKLVRVLKGKILDVAVDIRKNSPTFGKVFSVVLSEDNYLQLFMEKGFAHGFSVLSDEAVILYKTDQFYHPESEGGIYHADPALNIDWQIDLKDRIISDKDSNLPFFENAKIFE